MIRKIERSKGIDALPSVVWDTLTIPEKMKQWMGDREMNLKIITNWKAGQPIVISAFHHVKFENKGVVLQFEKDQVLRYTHLSSVSRLSDRPENYSVIEFKLLPLKNHTKLILTLENFPTDSIRKHLEFYWTTTLEIIKSQIEQIE